MKSDHPVAFKPETAADAWLGLLAPRGIEYLFANGGTDMARVGAVTHGYGRLLSVHVAVAVGDPVWPLPL